MNRNYTYLDDYDSVNKILVEWNPINLASNIAEEVYSQSVPGFLLFRNDLDGLVVEMEKIVLSILGHGFDLNNTEHPKNILIFANKIIQALKENEIKTYGDKLISFSELLDATENDTSDSRVKENANLLLSALIDYPTFNLKEPLDLLNELKGQIDPPLSYDNINDFDKKLSFDMPDNVWKKEALFSILEMFFWDKSKTLDDLVIEISKHYKMKTAT